MRKTAQPVTKQDFVRFQKSLDGKMLKYRDDFLTELRDFRVFVDTRFNWVEGELTTIHGQVGELQEDMTKVKLAVIDLTGTDRTVRHLVRELKGQGIKLDESKIF